MSSRRTTTTYAILSLLGVRSWTTYELAKQVRRSLNWFWPRAERKLYDEPKRLVADGLATAKAESTGKRPRTVYGITDAGRDELRRWLDEPSAPRTSEFEAMVKVFFADAGTLDQLRTTLGRIRDEAVERMDRLGELTAAVAAEPTFPQRLHINALTVRLQLEQELSVLRWAEWAEEQIAHWRDTDDPGEWNVRGHWRRSSSTAEQQLEDEMATSSTNAERTRDRLGALACAGLDASTFALHALEILRTALPFCAGCLATTDPATGLVTGTVKSNWRLADGEDAAWAHHEYEVPGQYGFVDVARRPGGVTTAVAETGGDVTRLCRFSEFFVPCYDFGDELRATASVEGAVWGLVALFRDGSTSAFTPAELDFVASVSPLFGRGVRSGLVAGAVDRSAVADGPAVLVVDATGEVVLAGAAAAACVEDLGGGPLDTERLPFALVSLVGAARSYAAGRTDVVPRSRLRTRSGRWVVAHASPLASRDGGSTDVVVTIEEARPPEIVPLMVAAFGLSAREQEVVRLVLQGVDTSEIARTLHLSRYTVQDHLKSVFDKVGVRSRRELTARVFFDQYAPRLAAGAGVTPSGWFAPAA